MLARCRPRRYRDIIGKNQGMIGAAVSAAARGAEQVRSRCHGQGEAALSTGEQWLVANAGLDYETFDSGILFAITSTLNASAK